MVADAELCWAAEKLVLLRDDQADLFDSWSQQGWAVLVMDKRPQRSVIRNGRQLSPSD